MHAPSASSRSRERAVSNAASCLPLLTALACAPSTDELLPPTADRDPRLPQIEIMVAGHRRAIHLETFGSPDAPVLLAFHGGWGSDYRAMLPLESLADRYFVVLWDSRGSGLSERIGRSEISESAYAEEVQAIKQRFSPDAPITLIGYSDGGTHAGLYVAHHAREVEQLVLIEPDAFDSETRSLEPEPEVEAFAQWTHEYLWQNEFLTPDDHESADYKLTSVAEPAIASVACHPESPIPYRLWRMGAFVYFAVRDEFRKFDFRPALAKFEPEILIVATPCHGLDADYQRTHIAPTFAHVRVVELSLKVDHLNLFDAGHAELTKALHGYLHAYREVSP